MTTCLIFPIDPLARRIDGSIDPLSCRIDGSVCTVDEFADEPGFAPHAVRTAKRQLSKIKRYFMGLETFVPYTRAFPCLTFEALKNEALDSRMLGLLPKRHVDLRETDGRCTPSKLAAQ